MKFIYLLLFLLITSCHKNNTNSDLNSNQTSNSNPSNDSTIPSNDTNNPPKSENNLEQIDDNLLPPSWACLYRSSELPNDGISRLNHFIGYGDTERDAQLSVLEKCNNIPGANCLDIGYRCEKQNQTQTAWKCYTTKYYGNGEKYWGIGASKSEAGISAVASCFNSLDHNNTRIYCWDPDAFTDERCSND